MRVLGIRSAPDISWLAIVENGIVSPRPDRLELSREPRPVSLLSILEQVGVLLREENIEAIAVADAHSNKGPKSLKEARRRLVFEFVVEIAAARADIPYQVLSPQAIQGALGLPTRRIEDHVDSVVAESGARWSKRAPAALAALALAALTDEEG